MNFCLQKLYYASIYIFYLLFISRQFQKCKNDVNPTSTSKDTCKTIFIILFKLFSIGDSFKFKVTRETDLVMHQCYSCENVEEFIVTSPHVMPHPIIS